MASPDKVVEYWDDCYVPKYMSNSAGDLCLNQVDTAVLYEAIDNLQVKVAGDTTGVTNIEWFYDIEKPDIRNPFEVMVNTVKNGLLPVL